MSTLKKIIVIGGSAGSIPVIREILSGLSEQHSVPIIICIHRKKNTSAGMCEIFNSVSKIKVVEPDDKQPILNGLAYLAPSNYHMLIEKDTRISLSTEEPVHYSRPSIDITFSSCAEVYGRACTGILLTGANQDGAEGIRAIRLKDGTTIIQDPKTCHAPFMPLAALELKCVDFIMDVHNIIGFINHYS